MQRMLELPVDGPDEAADIAAASLHLANWPKKLEDSPAGGSETPTQQSISLPAGIQDISAGTPAPTPIPLTQVSRVNEVRNLPAVPSPLSDWDSLESEGPSSELAPLSPEPSPFEFAPPKQKQKEETASTSVLKESAAQAVPVPALFLPLVLLNQAFDGCTCLLGPFGRWLRSPSGRASLGGSGVLLLLAALVWVTIDALELDVMGWTR